jgi:hypothetical protein
LFFLLEGFAVRDEFLWEVCFLSFWSVSGGGFVEGFVNCIRCAFAKGSSSDEARACARLETKCARACARTCF